MAPLHLKAGVAEQEFSLPLGRELSQEMAPVVASSALTPLMIKAVVLFSENTTLVVVTLDVYGLEGSCAQRMQQAIASRLGVSPEAVLITCSHTRGGPLTTGIVGHSDPDSAALDALVAIAPDVAAQAKNALQDASLGVGKVRLPHLVYNHRLMTRNMRAISAWMGIPKNEVLEPEGPTDPEFSVMVLRDPRGFPICLLWNFAADNRFPAGTAISAGLPHFVQQEVDGRLGRHLPLLYLPGCGGNASFNCGLEQAAESVASAVMAAYLETSCDPDIRLDFKAETMILPVRDVSCFWSQPDVELKAHDAVDAFAREVERLHKEGARAVPAQVQVFRLGRFGLSGLPGVPFSELGLEIKQSSPAQEMLLVSNTGGHLGYLPTRQAFEGAGFETWPARSSLAGPGAGEFIVDETCRLARALWK